MRKVILIGGVVLLSTAFVAAMEGSNPSSATQAPPTTRQRVHSAFDAFDGVEENQRAQARHAAAEEELNTSKKHVALAGTIVEAQDKVRKVAVVFDHMEKALVAAKNTMDDLIGETDPRKVKAGLPKAASTLRQVVVDGQKPFVGSNRRSTCQGTNHTALFTGTLAQADLMIVIIRAASAKSKRIDQLQQSDFDVLFQLQTTGPATEVWKGNLDTALEMLSTPYAFVKDNFSCVLDGLKLIDTLTGKPLPEFTHGKRISFVFPAPTPQKLGYTAVIADELTEYGLPQREVSYEPTLAYADVLAWLSDEASKPLRKTEGFQDAIKTIAFKMRDDIEALGGEVNRLLDHISEMVEDLKMISSQLSHT